MLHTTASWQWLVLPPVFLAGQLHLCPLQAIVQLRPSLQHLDQAAAGRRSSAATEASSDGDTTESEGEEARPVTVKFARRETGIVRYAPSFPYHQLPIFSALFAEVSMCHGVSGPAGK